MAIFFGNMSMMLGDTGRRTELGNATGTPARIYGILGSV